MKIEIKYGSSQLESAAPRCSFSKRVCGWARVLLTHVKTPGEMGERQEAACSILLRRELRGVSESRREAWGQPSQSSLGCPHFVTGPCGSPA